MTNTTSKYIEIMSPVGSFAALQAAIQGGADAVYFGAGHLNMRSKSSHNFSFDDIKEIVSICKKHNIKTYLTVNTIIYNNELSEMRKIVELAKQEGVTAIIASDIAVIQYAHQLGVEIHISTQSNITNIEEVKFYAMFADVMVTARELTLNQVAEITTEIEKQQIKGPSGNLVQIEIFAHGALCMAVSGKCYISLHTLNSSANRGACLQPCRRAYEVKDADRDLSMKIENENIMSPKDLKTIHFLNKILDAGVTVLKIEGRGRSPEYVKTVTKTYREAADAYLDGTFSKEKIENWNNQLAAVYNRGFWDGYYLGQRLGEWTESYGSQATKTKLFIGKISNYFSKIGVIEFKVETNSLDVGDEIVIIGETTGVYDGKVKELRVDLKKTNHVKKGDVCSMPVTDLIRRGDKLYKVIERKTKDII